MYVAGQPITVRWDIKPYKMTDATTPNTGKMDVTGFNPGNGNARYDTEGTFAATNVTQQLPTENAPGFWQGTYLYPKAGMHRLQLVRIEDTQDGAQPNDVYHVISEVIINVVEIDSFFNTTTKYYI